jgi:predicted nucleotidyltransferase
MLCVRPDRPVDPLTIAVLHEVNSVVSELGLPYFVAGATARDIVLTNIFGLNTGLATRDVDFAFAVENWEQFETIKTKFVSRGKFKPADKEVHRLYYKPRNGGKGYPIDIIPFRGVEQPPNTIVWPPDLGIIMNVAGYEEALATSTAVQIQPDLIVQVVSLPGLALLKLFAWTDRGNRDTKDALDLVTLLRTYNEAGNQDRLYGEEFRMLEAAGFDPVLAGPQLLGKDIRSLAMPATLERVMSILNDTKLIDRLVTHMAPRLRSTDDPIAAAERLLDQFKAGLTGQ